MLRVRLVEWWLSIQLPICRFYRYPGTVHQFQILLAANFGASVAICFAAGTFEAMTTFKVSTTPRINQILLEAGRIQ
jgi:hypothetical protein